MVPQPALAQLVLPFRRELAQALECLPRRAPLLRRHRRPVADALLEALLLDRAHVGVLARGAEQPLLLVAGHAVPVRRDGPEDALLLRAQAPPRRLRRR